MMGVSAQCGKNIRFIAYLTDRIFREIFTADADYKIYVELG